MGLGFPSTTAFLFAEILVGGLHLEEIFHDSARLHFSFTCP
jgi:hypothetical protein